MAKRYKRKTGIGYITFMVLCICLVLFLAKVNLNKEKEELVREDIELQALISEEEERAKDVKNLEAYVQTKKHIEDVARNQLGLVYEDEILFESDEQQ